MRKKKEEHKRPRPPGSQRVPPGKASKARRLAVRTPKKGSESEASSTGSTKSVATARSGGKSAAVKQSKRAQARAEEQLRQKLGKRKQGKKAKVEKDEKVEKVEKGDDPPSVDVTERVGEITASESTIMKSKCLYDCLLFFAVMCFYLCIPICSV